MQSCRITMLNGNLQASTTRLLAVSVLCVQLILSRSQPSSSNETGLFSGKRSSVFVTIIVYINISLAVKCTHLSDIWNSLTTVGKTSSCPGECLHAITSIFCDNVLEDIPCGEPHLRCCANSQISLASPVEASPSVTSTESTAETFSVISNNHNSSMTTTQPAVDPSLAIGTTNAWDLDLSTTTTAGCVVKKRVII